jgi:uncharacterized protein (DUF3084 family)
MSSSAESPVVGLVAAATVVAAVSGYALVLADADTPTDRDETVATTTLSRAHTAVTSGGVAVPARLANATSAVPPEYDLRVTLSAAGRSWRAGDQPPSDPAAVAADDRRVGVAVGPGRIRPGRLRVEVWR